jgi:hypothetical protein
MYDVLYVVCTNCSFLRAYSSRGSSMPAPEACPQCGGELLQRSGDGRFPPAYVSRVRFDLFATPELGQPPRPPNAA